MFLDSVILFRSCKHIEFVPLFLFSLIYTTKKKLWEHIPFLTKKGCMNKMNPTDNDEIDLFELFEILYAGKWLIASFTSLCLLFGGIFLGIKEAQYESRIIIKSENIPPFYGYDKVISDFERLFFSTKKFGEWKAVRGDTTITIEDLNKDITIDGYEFSINPKKMLVLFSRDKKSGNFILVKSGQLDVVNSIFDYSNYISESLSTSYAKRAQDELKLIEVRSDKLLLAGADSSIIQTLLSIDRFIVSLENGGDILTIEKPSIPKKSSPKTIFVLALSAAFGGIIGLALLLVRNAAAKRKNRLAKP